MDARLTFQDQEFLSLPPSSGLHWVRNWLSDQGLIEICLPGLHALH